MPLPAHLEAGTVNVACVGNPTLDLIVTNVGPDHVSGLKKRIDANRYISLVRDRGEGGVIYGGGNAPNIAFGLRDLITTEQMRDTSSPIHSIGVMSVLGAHDPATRHYLNELAGSDILNLSPAPIDDTRITMGRSFVALPERCGPECNRMIYSCRPSPEYWSDPTALLPDEHLRANLSEAAVVTITSPKSLALVERTIGDDDILDPTRQLVIFTPGGVELEDPARLRRAIIGRLGILICNGEEMAQFTGCDESLDVLPGVADRMASELKTILLLSLGKYGSFLTDGSGGVFGAAPDVSDEEIVDTLGAGDAATAAATNESTKAIVNGVSLDPITLFDAIGEMTARAIRRKGARRPFGYPREALNFHRNGRLEQVA